MDPDIFVNLYEFFTLASPLFAIPFLIQISFLRHQIYTFNQVKYEDLNSYISTFMLCIFTFKFCVLIRRHNLSDRSLRVLQLPSYLPKLPINKL